MIDFTKLEHETRCYALVGYFLKRWSLMETALESCLKAALRTSDDALHILCRHLNFVGKVYILRCVLQSTVPDQLPDKSTFTALLVEIEKVAPDRNLLAHSPFEHDSGDDGVVFVEIKARAKYTNEKPSWSIKKFCEKFSDLDRFTERLASLATLLEKHPMTQESAARAAASLGWLSTSSWDAGQHVVYSQRRHMSPALLNILTSGMGKAPE